MALTNLAKTIGVVSGAINTKGAYIQAIASTSFASSRLYLIFESTTAASRLFLIDIATGAVSAETVIISNIAVHGDSEFATGDFVSIDVDIPAGTRIALRCSSPTATSQMGVSIILEDRRISGLSNPVTLGTLDTANSRGVSVDPGTTINTKGAYVQFTASTSTRIDALAIFVTMDTQAVAVAAFSRWYLDVATGGSGTETVVIPDVTFLAVTLADKVRTGIMRFPVSIPTGTRIAVRCECNINTAVRLIRVTLIGMQEPSTATSVAYVG